jgi:hypothetical protein
VISDNVSSITTTAAIKSLTGITNPSSDTLTTATSTGTTIFTTFATAAIPNATSTLTGAVFVTPDTTSTTTTTAVNLTKIIKELAESGCIQEDTSTSFLKAAAVVVVVLVGVILGTLLLTCLWGLCRDCCRDRKKLKKEKSRLLAAAALRDIAMRHYLNSARQSSLDRRPTPYIPQQSPISSAQSSLTAPLQFNSAGCGRGMQPKQTLQRSPFLGSGQSILKFVSSSGYSSSSSSSSSSPKGKKLSSFFFFLFIPPSQTYKNG